MRAEKETCGCVSLLGVSAIFWPN